MWLSEIDIVTCTGHYRQKTSLTRLLCLTRDHPHYLCVTDAASPEAPNTMAEPIPSATHAADPADDEQAQDLPNNAEDRKAAAALNSLNANAMSQENGEGAAKQPSAADQEALGKAMSRLEIASGGVKKSDGAKKPDQKKDAEPKKKIKISSEDVAFLVRVSLSVRRVQYADRLLGRRARPYQDQGHRPASYS